MAINPSTSMDIPIEYKLSMAMERISDDATLDLRAIVEKVDNNRAMKEQVRLLQKQLELYKMAVNNNDPREAATQKKALIDTMTKPTSQGGLGLAPDSAEVKAAKNLPSSQYTKEGQYLSPQTYGSKAWPASAEDRDKILTNEVKGLETILEGRAQSLSDLGQKFQFQLTEANNIFQRANKMQADIAKANSDTANAIVKHLA